jgi:hypothetical protein
MKTRAGLASIAIVLLTLLSSLRVAAAAGEDPEELIQEGVKLRRRGEDARAEGYFLRAYQLAATPRSAAQLGLVELALGEFLEAETHLTEALGKRDAWVTEHRQAIEDGRAKARKHLVRVELAPLPAETTVSIAGAPPVTVPGDGAIWVLSGKAATLRLEAPGHKGTVVQVEGADGETRHVSVDMPALASPIPPPPVARPSEPPAASPGPAATGEPTSTPAAAAPVETTPTEPGPASPGRGLRVAGIVVGAAGVAAGIAGAVLIAQAGSKQDSLQADLNVPGKVTNDAYVSRNDSLKSERTLGIACAAVGGAALVTGAILFVVGRQAGPEEGTKTSFNSGPSFGLAPGPGFGLLSFSGRF